MVSSIDFIHQILATNTFLKKIGVKDSALCSFCNIEEETLMHLYYDCKLVSRLWYLVEQWIYEKTGILLNYTTFEIVFGNLVDNSVHKILLFI